MIPRVSGLWERFEWRFAPRALPLAVGGSELAVWLYGPSGPSAYERRSAATGALRRLVRSLVVETHSAQVAHRGPAGEKIEGRKPVEISQRSVIDLERILQGVRDTFPTHQWTKALAAFLHRDLLG